jgi:hypothetical protein
VAGGGLGGRGAGVIAGMRESVVRVAFYLAVISAAALVWGAVNWVSGSRTPESAYNVGFAGQDDECRAGILYLNKFQGDQMVCTVKLSTPIPAEGGAVGAFKQPDVDLIVGKATALAADGSLDSSDRAQIEEIVNDLRRSHGERIGPRSPSQVREGRLYVGIAGPLLGVAVLALTGLWIQGRLSRAGRGTRRGG